MKVQGKFKMQAHIKSGVVMDVAAFKVCHSVDTDAAALQAARVRSKSMGRWMKVQGKFKTQTHRSRGVVMDIAAFKVSHSVGIDIDATALRAARRGQAPSIGAIERLRMGSICGKAHPPLPHNT